MNVRILLPVCRVCKNIVLDKTNKYFFLNKSGVCPVYQAAYAKMDMTT